LSNDFEIIVAGSGIAGLTAGLTAARLGRSVIVLTGSTLGGHLLSIERIDGCPGFAEGVAGYDLCPTIQEQGTEAGAEFAMSAVEGFAREADRWQVDTPGGRYSGRALIVATGTALRSLDVPGENLLRGKGVSQCASCDAPLLRDKPVVVAGGGDSAMQEALTLAEHCSHVTIVHHGDVLTGQQAYRKQIEGNARITLVPGSEVVEIIGDEAVTGVTVRRLDGGETSALDCESVFVFVGLAPASGFVADRSLLDGHGYIVTDAVLRAAQPGLFAAGTVRAASVARAASAAGEGAAAAIAADAWLRNGLWS
jgi:thioredoxin reductase (NADPH)